MCPEHVGEELISLLPCCSTMKSKLIHYCATYDHRTLNTNLPAQSVVCVYSVSKSFNLKAKFGCSITGSCFQVTASRHPITTSAKQFCATDLNCGSFSEIFKQDSFGRAHEGALGLRSGRFRRGGTRMLLPCIS